jgi:hypothetical protein
VNPTNPILSAIGIVLGVGLYTLIGRAPEPLNRYLYGLFFIALGALIWRWGKGDRVSTIAGVVAAVYGVVRVFLV